MNRVEQNILQTNPHILFLAVKNKREYEFRIWEDCYKRLEEEHRNSSAGTIRCKSGSKKYIRYLKRQMKIHHEREEAFYELEQEIMTGKYIGDKI